MTRYHEIDGWRGYEIPDLAVAGASVTGEFEDSPAPTHIAKAELKRLQKHLKDSGIDTELKGSESSNVFMGKLWVVVKDHDNFEKAGLLAEDWLSKHKDDTRLIHDADLPKGIKKLREVV